MTVQASKSRTPSPRLRQGRRRGRTGHCAHRWLPSCAPTTTARCRKFALSLAYVGWAATRPERPDREEAKVWSSCCSLLPLKFFLLRVFTRHRWVAIVRVFSLSKFECSVRSAGRSSIITFFGRRPQRGTKSAKTLCVVATWVVTWISAHAQCTARAVGGGFCRWFPLQTTEQR